MRLGYAPTRCRQVSAIQTRAILPDCFHPLRHFAVTAPPRHWTCRATFHHNRLQRHDLTFELLVCEVAKGHVDCTLNDLDARYIVAYQLVRVGHARCSVIPGQRSLLLTVLLNGPLKFRGKTERLGDLSANGVVLIRRDGDSGEDTDDGDHYHQLDQREARLTHSSLLQMFEPSEKIGRYIADTKVATRK